jgi:ABC-type nickel/cobalt efflux system permease component RcnA
MPAEVLGLALALLLAGLGAVLAQAPPSAFGGAARPPAPDGLVGWIIAEQARFYRQLSQAVRSIRSGEAGAMASLLGVSFLYGVFHAAGPGHGKAVISSYIVATGETVRRGVVLAGLSSLVQALTAIALVGFLAALIGVTARTMSQMVNWVEILAYGLIVAIGIRLLWQKGRAFLARLGAWRDGRAVAGMGCDDTCAHLPAAEQVARVHSWREALAIIVSVGLRPCTGAVLVLVFALS